MEIDSVQCRMSHTGWLITCVDESGRYYWHPRTDLDFTAARRLAEKVEKASRINPAHWMTRSRDGEAKHAS